MKVISDKENFIGHVFPQSKGESLLVTSEFIVTRGGKDKKYKCIFQKYPYIIYETKYHILRGQILNPRIEEEEFKNKIWKQNCGDSLKILEKTNKKQNGRSFLWKCSFIKYPYIVFKTKSEVLSKKILNPLIEKYSFIGKEFPQSFGDRILVTEETNLQKGNLKKFKVISKIYGNSFFATKTEIIRGTVNNPLLPWKSKENLKNFILNNFKGKPTYREIAKRLKFAYSSVEILINKYNLKNYCSLEESNKEQEIKKFLDNLNIKSEKYNDSKYEIDIYIPTLKIGIEFNGIYWHSKKFKDRNYHLFKSLYFYNKNIKLYHIWEDEFINSKQKILNFLKDIIFKGFSCLYVNEIDKHPELLHEYYEGNLEEPKLILRKYKNQKFLCWNCGNF